MIGALLADRAEPRPRVQVVVGAERYDQDVGLIYAAVRRRLPSLGVDRRDRLLDEPDSWPRLRPADESEHGGEGGEPVGPTSRRAENASEVEIDAGVGEETRP